jgi:hypothetical protein
MLKRQEMQNGSTRKHKRKHHSDSVILACERVAPGAQSPCLVVRTHRVRVVVAERALLSDEETQSASDLVIHLCTQMVRCTSRAEERLIGPESRGCRGKET